jgi:hypothetical protein
MNFTLSQLQRSQWINWLSDNDLSSSLQFSVSRSSILSLLPASSSLDDHFIAYIRPLALPWQAGVRLSSRSTNRIAGEWIALRDSNSNSSVAQFKISSLTTC